MPNNIRLVEDKVSVPVEQSLSVVALAGNPNVGKTTLFNNLTGGRRHVGNYPGVTVEKVAGICRYQGRKLTVVDLPGVYSLSAWSLEEMAARDYLVQQQASVVVGIVDAGNFERNMYLIVQMMELGVPLVVAMNMMDTAHRRGVLFDIGLLSELLQLPVVPMVASRGQGKEALLAAIVQRRQETLSPHPLHIDYGSDLESAISKLELMIDASRSDADVASSRWLAVKLLEQDEQLLERFAGTPVVEESARLVEQFESLMGDSPVSVIAERRYGYIAGICQKVARSTVELRQQWSDRIDAVVTHRILGLPIFLGLMYLVFQLTFTLGDPLMGWIEGGFEILSVWIGGFWPADSRSLLRSLLVDGVIGGVGGVLVFLPNILLLFLAIAILEDTGYMARAAFLMDRIMNRIGLHGKSFIPMLIGFGCSVPAIMATRTLENRRDRLLTMMVVPLMSCGARLPIYALIIPAFFPEAWHAPVLWIVYVVGIVLAIAVAQVLKLTILRGETPAFVMELPPYRVPTIRSVAMHMFNRGGAYLKKAGTLILGISIVLWAMQQWPGLPESQVSAFDKQRDQVVNQPDMLPEEQTLHLARIDYQEAKEALRHSALGRVGLMIEPIFKPCGFDWRVSTAMIGAFAAKEVFVSQMGIVFSLGEQDEQSESLRDQLRSAYTPVQGLSIMLFCLISAPCMATIAVTWRESRSWLWAAGQLVGLTILAWVVAFAVYQIGSWVV